MLPAAVAMVEAVWRVMRVFWKHSDVPADQTANLRVTLRRWYTTAVQLLLAAGTGLTATSPSGEEIGKPGAVALIHAALTSFLQGEFKAQTEEQAGPA